MANKIVRNNKIFENQQLEWQCLLTFDLTSCTKIFKLSSACRYISRIIEENKCSGLVSVDVMLRGKGFIKGSTDNRDINVIVADCDSQDNRYIQIKYIPVCFTFKPPVANVDTTIHVMNIIYDISKKYNSFDDKVVCNEKIYSLGGFNKFDIDGNYCKQHIEWTYKLINEDNLVPNNSSFNNEIVKYDKTFRLSNSARNIFKAINYDFTKHEMYLKDEDCKGYAAVYITVPMGKTVKDTEISKICKIYEDYVYADYDSKDVCFHIDIEGTLIATVDTPSWLVKPQNSVFILNLDNRTNLTDEEYRNQR